MRLRLLMVGGTSAAGALVILLAPVPARATDSACAGGIIYCGRVDDPHTNDNCTEFKLDPVTGHLVCVQWSSTDTYRHGP